MFSVHMYLYYKIYHTIINFSVIMSGMRDLYNTDDAFKTFLEVFNLRV